VGLVVGVGCGDNVKLLEPARRGPVEIQCEALAPIAGATCAVAGAGRATLLRGDVLTPTAMYRGGQVAIDARGLITCVGCECAAADQTVITCPDAAISPGLVNPHDHITFTQNPPYTDRGVRYEHRHQWRRGQDNKPRIEAPGGATADQIRWGELRFVMGGATSIVGSGGQPGLVRNLDSASQEGLGQRPVEFETFPLDDVNGARRVGDCNYGTSPITPADVAADDAYEPHTAEGLDASARNEFLCQSSATFDTMAPGLSANLLLPKTAMIHAIGLTAADLDAMAQARTALIWSPRSNITLYGDTARVTTAARLGVELALGTDWMPTGSMNMLRELRCAADLNATYYDGFFTDAELWQMATLNAAAVTATDDAIGLLAPSRVADIAVFRGAGAARAYGAVVAAEPADVALVMRGGKVLYGDAPVVEAFAADCDLVDVCGTPKRICLMSEVGKSYSQLQTAAGASIYPAFTCGAPPNEPSCTPQRPTAEAGSTIYTGAPSPADRDGDGIDDLSDACPAVFDPIRPVDSGAQADADGDGEGDACDPCPLAAGAASCPTVDPNDRDADGVVSSLDNCADVANAEQVDRDGDGRGDLCDPCPADANPGAASCPSTIYKIKTGATPMGDTARIANALVTGKGSNGFFVQVKPGDPGYLGADHSGLMVFTGPGSAALAAAVVGARVVVDGRVNSFQGQIQLDNVTAVIASPGIEAPPAPVPATYAEVRTGGARAAALEGVLVELGAATVTAVDSAFGEITLTSGSDSLVVDDFLYAPPALPVVGAPFTAVRGILALRQMASKLEPRGPTDLVAGPPVVSRLGPALSFARVGTTTAAPTFPAPLTVTLTGPAPADTVVAIASSDPAVLAVTDVVVPAGQTSALVPVTAVAAAAAPVTVTASIGAAARAASVRVLGAAEAPSAVTLSPASAVVAPGGSVALTAALDLPALAGGATVALAVAPAGAGTVPASVVVPEGQLSAAFSYTDVAGSGSATVTATLGAATSTATVTVAMATGHLVINEVDYDQVGGDAAEYIELYNPTAMPISLADKRLVLVNGSNSAAYDTIDLAMAPGGEVPAGGYLVIAGPNVAVPAPAIKYDPGWGADRIQNGAPDGIALIDVAAATLIDALSYEGAMTSVTLAGLSGPVSLVEGTPLPVATADSNTAVAALCRSPNGQDTDDAATDWRLCTALTPGAASP
jgi:cytosine/adenosine deaminase-related metal-dependent hydrolase